jgi:hypothetical protein
LFDKYEIIADGLLLNSMREKILPKEIEDKLEDVQKEIEFILEFCEIVDSIYNTTGLYKWARNISEKLGTQYWTEKDFSGEKIKVYKEYIPHDENEQVILITDNLNNLSEERREGKLMTKLETINSWTRDYCRLQITKHWKWTAINIIQQSSESERQQFDFKGNSIIDKIKPSLDGLGNSKECQRDHLLIFGLFAPARYNINSYFGYDITRLKDNFRSLIILKSNISDCNKEIPFYFNGACSVFRELKSSKDMTHKDYEVIEKLREV